MYTTFQAARCYYHRAWQSYLASIDTKYGLDRLDENTAEHFWNALRDHLLSSVVEFTKRNPGYKYSNFMVLTAGEAAHRPEFLEVVRSVAKSIPKLRTDHGAARPPKVELVISDDPTFLLLAGLLSGYARGWTGHIVMNLTASSCRSTIWSETAALSCDEWFDVVGSGQGFKCRIEGRRR